MNIENTFIPGHKIICLDKFTDTRGSFLKVFNSDFFKENGLETNFKESYYSVSHKNVVRGMHFQLPPFAHTKLVYLNSGRILDVILDLRKTSETYCQYFSVELNIANPLLVYIPVGCAHGFLSLEDNTMVTYLQSSCYSSNYDVGIQYNSFGFEWPIDKAIVSHRDSSFVSLSDFKSPF